MSKIELNLSTIGSMKKVEYEKLFQKTMTWKKAKSVIILADYKLAGKKSTVAIPYKKPVDMVKAFKELKKDKTHPLKKVAAGTFNLIKAADGSTQAEIELKKGGMSIEKLMEKVGPEFMSIGILLQVSGAAEEVGDEEDEGEAEEETTETPVESLSLNEIGKKVTKSIADFKNDLMLRYKSGELEEKDSIAMEEMKTAFQHFQNTAKGASTEEQNKYTPVIDAVQKIVPQLDKMMGALDGSDPQARLEMAFSELNTASKNIEKETKKIKKTVLKNLKKQQVSDADLDTVVALLEKIEHFENLYNSTENTIKEKLAKHYDRIKNQITPQIKQLEEKLTVSAPGKAAENADNADFQARLLEIEKLIAEEEKNLETAAKELEQVEPQKIPSGADLLGILD